MADSRSLSEIVGSLGHAQGVAEQIKAEADRFARLLDTEERGVFICWFSRGNLTRVRVEMLPPTATGRARLRGDKP